MLRKILLAFAATAVSVALSAQIPTGGVKGTVVDRSDRTPIEQATIILLQGATEVASTQSDVSGAFLVEGLEDGMYDMVVAATDYLDTRVNVTVNDGYVKNMFNVSMTHVTNVVEVDDASFADFDMADTGYHDAPTILFGQNDVFNNMAGYNFSSFRFRARGYSSESQEVYVAGIKMNDAITGYTPYSLWSGLNEATRSKDSVTGSEISDYGTGGYNGLTNIAADARSFRTGLRGSILTNSSLYRLRLMLSYGSGVLDNGWSYAFNVSARLGGNDWIRGVYYRSFGYFGSVSKQFDPVNRLTLSVMAAPGSRGAQNASTQEVYDLMGDNMYNSNWGYQGGKVRNTRVRITHEPIVFLKYDHTPNEDLSASATVLYRFGKNGYTALDWYDAYDPRPDYYRNLPSYYWIENADYDRVNTIGYAWAKEAWENKKADVAHVNWDRLYDVNENNLVDGAYRSKYVIQERRTDQKDLNLGTNFKWRVEKFFTLSGGAGAKLNRTEYFTVLNDLLGGDYYVDIDQFAEREYASMPYMVQNDLEYYMRHGYPRKVYKGDKYGYDYYAHVHNYSSWLSGRFTVGGFEGTIAGRLGFTTFWREGLMRKGLFPGVNDDGSPISWDGYFITSYDYNDEPITSYGKSKRLTFFNGGAKANLKYVLGGGHAFIGNVGWFSDAPTFSQSFISPRTRNSITPNLKNAKTFTSDLSYVLNNNGWNLRLTGFYTTIKDQSDVMNAYDDSQNSFTNFAMSGIDQRHMGIELGFKVPTPIPNLALQGVLAWGEYIYTSNPRMTQTIDNSASIVQNNVLVPYWKSHPVYKHDAEGNYATNADGSYILDHIKKHYVPGTPQLAASLGLAWNYNYWFIDADIDYLAHSYLDMNPLYRTDMATAGPDATITPLEIDYMASQEEFDPQWLLNVSVGKSWYIQRKYQIGFSLQGRNLLNNKWVKTGGYEQTRIIDDTRLRERYYRFDSKYFYMPGANYMMNLYFRF